MEVIDPKGPAFSHFLARKFCDQCHWAYEIWQMATVMFEPKIAQSLHASPLGHFWYRNITVIRDYCLLAISKFHDRAIIQDRINLTLDYVVEYGGWDKPTKKELCSLKKELDSLYSKIKDARNRIIAHYDLKTALSNEMLGEFPDGMDTLYFENLKTFAKMVHEKCADGLSFAFGEFGRRDAEAFFEQLPVRLGGLLIRFGDHAMVKCKNPDCQKESSDDQWKIEGGSNLIRCPVCNGAHRMVNYRKFSEGAGQFNLGDYQPDSGTPAQG